MGCPSVCACRRACRFGEESQQPTCPQVRHSRRCTHLDPERRHSSQPSGVRGTTGWTSLSRCRLAVLICSPPRSLRSSGLAALRCSLAVGSRYSSARLRARSAPRAWRPCDAHSLSARGSHLLASALAPLLGPGGPAMLTRCRLAVLISKSPRNPGAWGDSCPPHGGGRGCGSS